MVNGDASERSTGVTTQDRNVSRQFDLILAGVVGVVVLPFMLLLPMFMMGFTGAVSFGGQESTGNVTFWVVWSIGCVAQVASVWVLLYLRWRNE